jgi:hypothetical protein
MSWLPLTWKLELLPLLIHLRLDGRVPLDIVAHAHHELGLQPVELLDGTFVGAERAGTAAPVAQDGELEVVRIVLETLGTPGLRLRNL